MFEASGAGCNSSGAYNSELIDHVVPGACSHKTLMPLIDNKQLLYITWETGCAGAEAVTVEQAWAYSDDRTGL